MGPNLFVPIALTAYLLAAVGCMLFLPPRRAVPVLLVAGWLFLPHIDDHYRFLIFISKASYVATVLVVVSVIIDSEHWARLRFRVLDLAVVVFCAEAYFTAVQNGFDTKEGLRSLLDTVMAWGAPYLLGRVYFGSPRSARDLARALVGGALVYVLPSLWEIRMSPQLHQAFYGYRPFGFDQVIRFGGWRPSVFMQHGLALGFFMAIGALLAYWLWRTGRREKMAGLPMGWVTLLLTAMTLLCKSTGAVLLLAIGIGLLEATRRLRTPWLLVAATLAPAVYCTARIQGWGADTAVSLARSALNEERAGSLQFRFENEELLIRKAMRRPWLGWGRYGRSFVYSEEGVLMTITDSLWVIYLGTSGLLGLVMIGVLLLGPVLALLRRFPARSWAQPAVAPAAALSIVLVLWAIDDLLNAMVTPMYPVAAGALVTLAGAPATAFLRRRRRIPAAPPEVELASLGGPAPDPR
jgi:hypothetical protein